MDKAHRGGLPPSRCHPRWSGETCQRARTNPELMVTEKRPSSLFDQMIRHETLSEMMASVPSRDRSRGGLSASAQRPRRTGRPCPARARSIRASAPNSAMAHTAPGAVSPAPVLRDGASRCFVASCASPLARSSSRHFNVPSSARCSPIMDRARPGPGSCRHGRTRHPVARRDKDVGGQFSSVARGSDFWRC